ncbi:hypothetical protein [Parendozoicomonas haliclonae]|uniref:Uncharacterized protein n=1 Tax=Parendozoicomonas haliclonae TaxID=1960125 RepID=A0A1X7AHL8_9GAMM|nr:hypothetical protein [Parendozoicomonas haliclonae]SMA41815.1 hypothetical protein EHSB41UT_01334 [Parendozoicomonas haliclonae]
MPQSLEEYKAHRKALKAQIKETRALLEQLEAELEEERLEMGHEELDHLEEYMDKTGPHLGDLKTLGSAAISDFRKSVNDFASWVSGSKKK